VAAAVFRRLYSLKMLTGHLAVGFASKGLDPKISLGTAIFAAMLADFVAYVSLMAGFERFITQPGVITNRVIGANIAYSRRPDTPLAPGINRVFGLGLWNSVTTTLIVEADCGRSPRSSTFAPADRLQKHEELFSGLVSRSSRSYGTEI